MTRADSLLLLLLCLLIGGLFRAVWSGGDEARQLQLHAETGGRDWPLTADRLIEVDGPLGRSVVEIRDGAARFLSSPCRQQICVRSGWHRHAGAVAACVPNRISFKLSGGAASDYDGLSY